MVAWFSFTTPAAFFREAFSSNPPLMKSIASAISAVSANESRMLM